MLLSVFAIRGTMKLLVPYPLVRAHAMALLVEVLRCKQEGRGFGSRWYIGIFH